MSTYCSTSQPFVVTGPAEIIRDLLCGPQQHNEHCKAWRWHMYVQDDAKRWASVEAELRKMHAERRAREDMDPHVSALEAGWDHARALRLAALEGK